MQRVSVDVRWMEYVKVNVPHTKTTVYLCDRHEHRSSSAIPYFRRNGFRDTWSVPVPAGTSQYLSPPPSTGPSSSGSSSSTDLAYRCASEISRSDLTLLTVVPENRADEGPRSTMPRKFTGLRGTGARGGRPVTCEYIDSVSAASVTERAYCELGCPPSLPSAAMCRSSSKFRSRATRSATLSSFGIFRPRENGDLNKEPSFCRHPTPLASMFFASAKAAVRLARLARMRLRKSARTHTKIKTQPSVMSSISHHARRRPPFTAGEFSPVIVGSGTAAPEACTDTSSERHTPRPGTTVVVAVVVVPFPLQLAGTQDPPRRTELELEHARQLLGPELEQLEQLPSHD